jgi:hypothetical protein
MSNPDGKISHFVLQLGVVMVLTGHFISVILFGLATLILLPEDGVAGHFRNGLGLAVAIIIGMRLSRRLERRWGGE